MEEKNQEFAFAYGVDESDDAQGTPEGFAILENVRREKNKTVKKRGAFTEVATYGGDDPSDRPLGRLTALVPAAAGLGVLGSDGLVPALPRPYSTDWIDDPTKNNPRQNAVTNLIRRLSPGRSVYQVDMAYDSVTGNLGVIASCRRADPTEDSSAYELYFYGLSAAGEVLHVSKYRAQADRAACARIVAVTDSGTGYFIVTWLNLPASAEDSGGSAELYFRVVEPGNDWTAGSPVSIGQTLLLDPDSWAQAFVNHYDLRPSPTGASVAYVYWAEYIASYGAAHPAPLHISTLQTSGFVGDITLSETMPGTNAFTTQWPLALCPIQGGFQYNVGGVIHQINTSGTPTATAYDTGLGSLILMQVNACLTGTDPTASPAVTTWVFSPLTINEVVETVALRLEVVASALSEAAVAEFPNTFQLTRPTAGVGMLDGQVSLVLGSASTVNLKYGDGHAAAQRTGMLVVLDSDWTGDQTGQIRTVAKLFQDRAFAPDVEDRGWTWSAGPLVMVGSSLYASCPTTLETGVDPLGLRGFPYNTLDIVHARLFAEADQRTTLELNGLGYVDGAFPTVWSGEFSAAATFVDTPRQPAIIDADGDANISYCVVWEYTALDGNVIVSQPSPLQAGDPTQSGGQDLRLWLPSRLNSYTSGSIGRNVGLGELRWKLFRTVDPDSSALHLVTEGTVDVDDLGQGYADVTDTAADLASQEAIAAAEALDISDTVLQSSPVPPLSHLWTHRNRLFGIRADDPNQVVYTQETTPPFVAQWHAVLSLRVDNAGGPVYGGASLSDKCLLFQADQVMLVGGLGPDGTGSESRGGFSLPETAALGVGTTEPGSIVTTPQGVMFRHTTGYKLIGPDMAVSDVGRQIEDSLGSVAVTRAKYLPSLHQVWVFPAWESDEFRVLVWDCRFGQWYVFTQPELAERALDACEHNGTVYLLTANRLLSYSVDATRDTFTDLGDDGLPTVTADYDMYALTPWIRVDRAQELRCRKVHLSGTLDGSEGPSYVTLTAYTQRLREVAHDARNVDQTYAFTLPSSTGGEPFSRTARLVTQRCVALRLGVRVACEDYATSLATLTVDYAVSDSRGKTPLGTKPAVS